MASRPSPRVAELVRLLHLVPHPEGGYYREWFRSGGTVAADSGRRIRSALTSIDFVLDSGQFSAWHRVASDEVWHLLEGGPLRLWLARPELDAFDAVDLMPNVAQGTPRHAVPAGWWQAAELRGDFAYVGATVGPGFDFADFAFGRDDAALRAALQARAPELLALL
jgi:uncharacterized protein